MTGAADRISAAKLWLTAPTGGNVPYLSAALWAMPTIVTSDVPTIRADEQWRVYVNPDWVVEIPELAGHLSHLIWHLLRDHAGRARTMGVGKHESWTWSVAGDLTVSQTLSAAGHCSVDLPTPDERRLPSGLAVEEYFAMLDRLPASSSSDGEGELSLCGSAADGLPRSYELPCEGIPQLQGDEMRRQIAIAFTQHMKGRGTDPGEWSRWVEQILEPKVPWQQVLSSSVRRAVAWTHGNTHSTYSRLSRRRPAGVVLPGTRRPMPFVAIVVDTSGSMDDGLLAQALGEVDGVLQSLGSAVGQVQVYSCDAEVYAMGRVTKARDLKLVGGGGTDLRVGIEAAVAGRPRPDIVIVLTDGETPWPAAPPAGCTVVAVRITRSGAIATPDWVLAIDVNAA